MEPVDLPRAVIVDDNLMFAMMIEPQLRRLGYQVRTVSTAPVSPDVFASPAPDLLVVNMTSTRFSAADLIREVRARPELAKVPVIGYAGHVEREHFQAGRDAGADLVVPNSAVRASLAEVLEKLKRRLAGEPDEAVNA